MTIRIASFTDGTSNTHVAAELLQGASDDIRGTIWVDNPGGGSYMTRFTPNGYQDYVPLISPWSTAGLGQRAGQRQRGQPGGLRAARASGTSPAISGSLCDSQPGMQWPAVQLTRERGEEFAGVRSRHPGGVNALFGDGSVHFMKNSISALTWVQLGSISGGEVISSDSY